MTLPEPIETYFAAANARDADRAADCFTKDAIVHDEGGQHHGRAAVRTWVEETGRKYRFTATVTGVEAADDQAVVTAHLIGDFPGSPIDLRYRFKLADKRIASLEIGL